MSTLRIKECSAKFSVVQRTKPFRITISSLHTTTPASLAVMAPANVLVAFVKRLATMPNSLDNFLSTVERNAALDRDAALAPPPRSVAARNVPRALVLPIVICTCECGHVTRNINPSVIVRYDDAAQEGTVHFARRTLARYSMLPREVKELHCKVPFCEHCFLDTTERV